MIRSLLESLGTDRAGVRRQVFADLREFGPHYGLEWSTGELRPFEHRLRLQPFVADDVRASRETEFRGAGIVSPDDALNRK